MYSPPPPPPAAALLVALAYPPPAPAPQASIFTEVTPAGQTQLPVPAVENVSTVCANVVVVKAKKAFY